MTATPKMSEKQMLLRLSDQLEESIEDGERFLRESAAAGVCPAPELLAEEIRRLYRDDEPDGLFSINRSYIAEVANNYLADSAPADAPTPSEATSEQLDAIKSKLRENFGAQIHDMIVESVYEMLP